MSTPLLYTFRRCPYAIRARMALHVSGVAHIQVEVDLKHKPAAMLAISPKGTVPVLHLPDGRVIEESLEIMRFALGVNDPEHWLPHSDPDIQNTIALVAQNDKEFKPLLDKFKYHTRHPECSQAEHRMNGERILHDLEHRLEQHAFLLLDKPSLADIAIFPFVRQWAGVQASALDAFPHLEIWFQHFVQSPIFKAVMK